MYAIFSSTTQFTKLRLFQRQEVGTRDNEALR